MAVVTSLIRLDRLDSDQPYRSYQILAYYVDAVCAWVFLNKTEINKLATKNKIALDDAYTEIRNNK